MNRVACSFIYHLSSRLKIEDCVPDVEVKAKIDAWIEEGNRAGVKAKLAEDIDMDVDHL